MLLAIGYSIGHLGYSVSSGQSDCVTVKVTHHESSRLRATAATSAAIAPMSSLGWVAGSNI